MPDRETSDATSESLVALFHLVNGLLPDEQDLVTVPPNARVTEALELMRFHGFSQLPVVEGAQVLGVFSYRSFAQRVGGFGGRVDVDRLEVDDCLEDFGFVRVTDELDALFTFLDRDGAVLVGDPDRLVAVATATDLIRYLYGVTHPFVLIQEIELVLRGLVRMALSESDLEVHVRRAISYKRTDAEGELPTQLVDLTFAELVQLVTHGDNYADTFEALLGRNRASARGYLDPIPRLRNEIFHFRRAVTGEDLQTLVSTRTWLLRKARAAEARGRTR